MLGDVIDPLLGKEDVGTAARDLFHHLHEHVGLLVQERLDGVGAPDPDLCVELGLLHLYGRVYEGDLGFLDLLGHPVVDDLLVDDDPPHELGLVEALPLLLHYLDVFDVGDYLAVPLLDDLLDGVDYKVGEVFPRLGDRLAPQ